MNAPRPPRMIAFGHRARQGKDLLAERFHCRYPDLTWIFNFSTAIAVHARLMGLMQERNPRVLQIVGGCVQQSTREDLWIEQVAWQIHDRNPQIAIVTGVRRQTEFDWVRRCGGLAVKVSRQSKAGEPVVAADRDINHISEPELNDAPWDLHVQLTTDDGRTIEAGLQAVYRACRDRGWIPLTYRFETH